MPVTVVILLTVAAGATDALSFLALGRVFSSVMTGNTVLLGIAVGEGRPAPVLHAGAALAGYSAGTVVATRLGRTGEGRPTKWRTLIALAAELFVLTSVLTGWLAALGRPSGRLQVALLALAAAAMGAQSATVNAFPGPKQPTTRLTGTITGLLGSLAAGLGSGGRSRGAGALLALLAGAAACAALLAYARLLAPLLAPGVLVLALVRQVMAGMAPERVRG